MHDGPFTSRDSSIASYDLIAIQGKFSTDCYKQCIVNGLQYLIYSPCILMGLISIKSTDMKKYAYIV